MPVLQFHSKHCVRKGFDDRPFHFDDIIFRHTAHSLFCFVRICNYALVRISGPFTVTATVCSK